jgi:hypothetical protein
MASDYWAAARTAGGAEYAVTVDLKRLRLTPFCPQYYRHWTPDKSSTSLVKAYPLFPRYVLLPLAEARTREVQYVRGLRLPKPLLTVDGQIWQIPAEAVFELARLEHRADLDRTVLAGNWVRMTAVDLFLAQVAEQTAELFRPLWAVARPAAGSSIEMRAAE